MKVPAIVLAMVLGAASMSGQALAGYAAATAGSGATAAGAAKGINPVAGLDKKMAAAMGDAPQTATPAATGDRGTHSDMEGMQSDMKGMHSGMHCKRMHSDVQGMSGMHCKRMQGAKAGCCRKSKDGKMAHATGSCKHGKGAEEKKESEKKS